MIYDAIIIGSGVSGMTSAIMLAKAGKRVLVLEQHSTPGGLMQTYRRDGLLFPTGIHCVGMLAPGQTLWRYLKYLDVLDRLRLVSMDQNQFMELRFRSNTYSIPCDKKVFRERIGDYFGDEAAGNRFVSDMNKTVANFPFYSLGSHCETTLSGREMASLYDYLKTISDNPDLRAFLSGIFPLHGLLPSECPLYVHFLVLDSFLNSSYRIDENHITMSKAFVDALTDAGGEIRCNCNVVEIKCENGNATGVKLAEGEFLQTDTIVFTGHPKFLSSLCSPGTFRPAFAQRIENAPETPGASGTAIVWKDQTCPFTTSDSLIYENYDTGMTWEQYLTQASQPTALYCSAAAQATNGQRAVSAMCLSQCDDFAKWRNSSHRNRSEDYNEMKHEIAEQVLRALQRQWPGEAANMKIVDTYTPLTFQNYLQTPTGSAYGLKKSVSALRVSRVNTQTRVNGLFLAGQSVILSGVIGSVISAVKACSIILNQKDMVDRIVRETS